MEIEIPQHTKALIFDLDGTLADTMPRHVKAWQMAMKIHGVELPAQWIYDWAGLPSYDVIAHVSERTGVALDVTTLRKEKEEAFWKLDIPILPIGPIYDLAKSYRGKMPMAIGTGSIVQNADRIIEAMGFRDWFDAIVCSDQVEHAKPHPDTWLQCAVIMGIDPRHCLVMEDGDPGIEAAKAAGMMWVDIRGWV